MIFLDYLKNDFQSTKWGRMRVNYSLLEQVIRAKEYSEETKQPKKTLAIQSTVNPY